MKQPHQNHMEYILHSAVCNITPYRKNWCIETQDQKWIAKRVHYSEHLSWWLKVDQELRKRGFTAMPLILSDGSEWLLSPFVEGKTGKYNQKDEVKKMIKVLADFHRLGRGLSTPPQTGAAFLLYHRLHERLVQFYHVMKKAHHIDGELGVLLRTRGKDYYLDGLNVWEKLGKYPLLKLNQEERLMRYLTHRDLASHNWIIDHKGHPWLIDFDTADYDCQLGDVWQMSSRILSENDWGDEWCDLILLSYDSIRPLSSLEKRLIHILFSFPNEFFRESIGLVENKRGYTLKYTLPYLKKIAEGRQVWRAQLKRIFYW